MSETKPKSGICFLVGAGPGDPDLLTIKGLRCLKRAEAVVYDCLVNPELLGLAAANAERIAVGKRAGRHSHSHSQSMSQEETNALLVRLVGEGKVVVRLKGGDPFLFGRGGEEAAALAAAGCAFEVVPGVSSALGGPAYAGIPVTHRAHNSQLTIFTGHEDASRATSRLDYAVLAATPGTQVMLMGGGRVGDHARALIAAGMSPETPLALIQQATTPRQKTRVGTLANADALSTDLEEPVLAVMGSVVSLRKELAWFEKGPLFGRRIAVTRTRTQASDLLARLRMLGADAYAMPTIRIEPPTDRRAFYELVADAHAYDWIVFTSPNGVDAFFRTFFELYKDAREIGGVRIATVGPATTARVRAYHLAVDVQPETYVGEAIIDALQKEASLEHLKILLPRAEGAREALAVGLVRLGAIVDEAIAYRTVPETGDVAGGIRRFREEGADIVTFTSSSAAKNFAALKLPPPPSLLTASIGPVTSATLRDLGLPVSIEAQPHDLEGLVNAIRKHFD